MGAILTRTAWASQAVVWLLCLLGLIGKGLSFITSEDLWEIQESHLRAMQLGVDDAPGHGDIRAPISVKEIAQKISGGPAEGAKHVGPETACGPRIRQELTDQVAEPFKQSLRDVTFGSIEQTEKRHQNLVGQTYKLLKNLIEQIPLDMNTPSSLQEGMEENAFRIQIYEETVSKFFRKTKNILDILQDPHLVITLSSVDSHPITLTTALYNINDILVRLLVISEKHQLLSERGIQNLMENEEMYQFIFNYILRRFRIRSDITSFYLNSDLKLSLEESPFTEELRGILKFFHTANWRKLECLFVGAQVKSFEKDFGQISIQKEFLKVTSSSMLKRVGTPYFDKKVMTFMKDLVHLTSAIPVKDNINAKTGTNILKLKLLHNMLRIMNRYIVGQASKEIQRTIKYLTHNPRSTSNLQAFDESMILFSDVLKSVYVKYGETLQKLPEGVKSDPDFKKKVEEKIYLTDLNKKNQPSMFSTANQDNSKFNHSESDCFIGVNHPHYRFQHLFEHTDSSNLLPMGAKLFRTKLKSELKVEGLKVIIQPILERLQKIDTSSEASLYTKFDQLGHILRHPNSKLIYNCGRLSNQ